MYGSGHFRWTMHYPVATKDFAGEPLSGSNKYIIHFEKVIGPYRNKSNSFFPASPLPFSGMAIVLMLNFILVKPKSWSLH
jgi:hypothetical protein